MATSSLSSTTPFATSPVINGWSGTATLVAGTAFANFPGISASHKVIVSRMTTGGTVGDLSTVTTVNSGVTINSSSATETSTVAILVVT